jgi:PAS domain S-box-containing protein
MHDSGLVPIRVLAVDDEEDVLGFYQAVFRPWSPDADDHEAPPPAGEQGTGTCTIFDLSVCAQGVEAVESVQAAVDAGHPFAVVFLDLRMPPGPDGVWAAEQIRKIDPDINIVIVTGHAGTNPQAIADRVPPVDKLLYVEKPLRSREIEQFAMTLGARWRAEGLLRSSFAALEARVAERTVELTAANEALRQKIAEREVAERALKESEERTALSQRNLQTILDSMPFGVVIVGKDKTVRHANKSALAAMGYESLPEILGKICHGTLCPATQCPILDLGQTMDRAERTLLTRDGQAVPILKSVIPVSLEDEEVLLEAFVDVTERKLAEAERTRLISAIGQASEAILLTDLKGKILYVNPAFKTITGYACSEAVGENARLFVSREGDKNTYRAVARTVLAGDTWTGVLRRRRKDGVFYDAEVTVSPVRNDSGDLVNYVAVFRDVTRVTELERRLRHAEKMEAIGTLAGGIAHDFNNILGGIIGLAECALGRTGSDDRAAECLNEILGAGKRGAALTRQILMFSRRTDHQHTPMHVRPVLRDALTLLRGSLPSTIEIREVIDPECGLIHADPSQIHQVIMNLCTNAFHAMENSGGVLEVGLKQRNIGRAQSSRLEGLSPGTYVLLSVSDTGPGMDDDTLRRVFEPYFTTKEAGRGTGLGLATAHGIVRSHRGAIVAESSPGGGSSFSVYLPLCDSDHLQAPTPVPDAEGLAGNERVLLVDDEEILVKSGTALFENYGYKVTATTDSVAALEAFREAPGSFDVVVTDQTMPRLTGSELSKELLRLRPDLPIVLTTGFSEAISADQARALGIREYVPKPAGARELVGAVRRALGLGAPLA